MKTKITILKLFIILCSAFAATAGFGQTTYVWTNQYQAHLAGAGDMNQATNWSPNGVPNPMTGPDANGVCGDLMQFAGLTTGPVSVTEGGGTLGGSGGQSSPYGARIELTSAQTASVTIFSVVSVSGGLRMNWFTIDPGAGPLILGDHSGNSFRIIGGERNGQVLGFTNNTTVPCVINETVSWSLGGAGAHPFVFAGTGDWIVNNHMRGVESAILIQKFGPGMMTWTGTNVPNSSYYGYLGNPVTIGGGTLILKSSDLLNADAGSPNIVNNGTLLKFDYTPAPGIITTPDSIAGAVSGTGPIQVNAGTITLAGASTFTGNINLTGGELIAGRAENVGISGPFGQAGTISFSGGTLGFSTNNTFDYSSRFSTAGGQVYSFDTAGQNVTFTTGLGSSGGTLTKLGGGTLTLSGASSYSGLTTVNSGKLVFQGPKTGSGSITVADGAALGVYDAGTPVTPATLTLGSNSGCTLEFNSVTNTASAPLAAGTLSSTGTITININSGAFTIGQSYPLLTWTSGSAPTVSLGSVVGTLGNLSTNGNTIQFNVAAVTLIWSGANNGIWDTTTPNNWTEEGSPTNYFNPAWVRFDDTASGTTTVIVSSVVQPTSVTISNSNKSYNLTSGGSNSIAGSAGLTKSGNGALTLSGGANAYTGVTTISGGTLSVGTLASGGLASDIGAATSAATNLVLDGGTLQYTGVGASIDRLFTLGTLGGTIDASGSGALNFTNSGLVVVSDGGTRTLALTGTNTDTNTLAAALSDSFIGATSLTKSGPGTWVLTGTNTYSGGTTIGSGVLRVGNGGGTGSLGTGNITNNGALDFNCTNTLTVSGAISGIGSVTNDGTGTVILLSNGNTYSGNTTINSGTLQLSGTLNGNILNHGTLLGYNATVGGVISGPGQVTVSVGGFLQLLADNTYTSGTAIGALSTLHVGNGGTSGSVGPGDISNYDGVFIWNRSDAVTLTNAISGAYGDLWQFGPGTLTLSGPGTYTGRTFVYGGGTLILNSGNLAYYTTVLDGTLGGTGMLSGPVTVNAGTTLAPGASAGSVGTLTINNSLTNGGNLAIEVNKSLAQSNDLVVVSGVLINAGTGTLTVANLGPALAAGDKFTLFSKPMQNGAAMAVTGAGATWANNLAVDGSISVTAVTVPTLNFTKAGNNLQFSWDTSFGNYKLQSQTNSLNSGISTNWSDYSGGGSSPVTVPINSLNETVFFRLVSP